jgi:alpha-1,3-rhamnosyl/mannosyltransferase
MKVVVDARTAHKGFPGIGRYVSGLLWGFREVSGDLSLSILSAQDADGPYGLPDFCSVPCRPGPFSLAQQWAVPRLLSRLKPAVYHSPYYLMPYRPGVPTVLTCHDVIPSVFPRYFTRSQRIVYGVATRMALRASSAVIAVSRQTKEDLVGHFAVKPETVTVVAEAPAPLFGPRPAGETAAVLRRYGLSERYVLCVGTNKPHKNLVRLVEAWSAVQSGPELRNVTLVVAGHWDDRFPEPKKAAETLGCRGSILFPGAVTDEDLPALYSGAELFIMPSLYEGFGLPVLEAMACGAPVACSKAGSLPEVAGGAALTFDPLSTEDMAGALRAALSNPSVLDGLRAAGRERAGMFSWRRTAELTAQVYKRAAEGAGR